MNHKFKKIILISFLSLVWVSPARAEWPTIDVAAIGQMVKDSAQRAAEHAELLLTQAAQHSALLTQMMQVAGMQSTANEQTQKQIAKTKTDEKNADREADNAKEQIRRDSDAAEALRPTLIACKQRAASSAGAGARGGGGGAAPAKIAQQVSSARDKTVSLPDAANQTIGNKKIDPDLCSASDITERGNGCGGAVGSKANADLKSGSIFAAAGTGPTAVIKPDGTVDASKADSNFVFDAKDQKIAKMSINNIISGAPPITLGKNAQNTPAGRAYIGMVDRYNSRLSTGIDTLTYMAGLRAEAQNMTSGQQEAWKNFSAYIPKLYPARKAPEKPSVYEYMNTQAYYTDLKEYQKQLDQISDPVLATKELIRRVNFNTQVQWMNYTLMEKMAAVQSAALAQGVEPISREMLSALKAEAESQTVK